MSTPSFAVVAGHPRSPVILHSPRPPSRVGADTAKGRMLTSDAQPAGVRV